MNAIDLAKLYVEENCKDVTVETDTRRLTDGRPWFGVLTVTLNKPKRVFEIRSDHTELRLWNHCGSLDLYHPHSLQTLVKVIRWHMKGDCKKCPFEPCGEITNLKSWKTVDLLNLMAENRSRSHYYTKYVLSFREHIEKHKERRERKLKEMKKKQASRAKKTRGTKRRASRCRR